MSERLSSVYVSGNLGQALALVEGVAMIFNGKTVNRATETEINLFFGVAPDFAPLPPETLQNLRFNDLSRLVGRETARADALRFLLMGMDPKLPDPLRIAAIGETATLLKQDDVLAFVLARFLKPVDPDHFDNMSAAVLAAMTEAPQATFLYLLVDDPQLIERFKAAGPEDVPRHDAKLLLSRHFDGARHAGPDRPVWELAALAAGAPLTGRHNWLRTAHTFARRFEKVPNENVRHEAARAMIAEAVLQFRLSRGAAEAIAALDAAASYARRIGRDVDQPVAAIAAICKAAILSRSNRHAEALAECTIVMGPLLERDDPLSRRWGAQGEFAVARALGALGREGEAIETYSHLVETFQQDDDGAVQLLVGKARYNRSNALLRRRDIHAARGGFIENIQRLDLDSGAGTRFLYAQSQYNLGCVNAMLGDKETALRSFREVLNACDRLAGARRDALFAVAAYNLGVIFAEVGDHGATIQSYSTALATAKGSKDSDMQLLSAQAMFNLALTLEVAGRIGDAAAAYHQLEARFKLTALTRGIIAKAYARRLRLGQRPAQDDLLIAPEDSVADEVFDPAILWANDDDA